MNHFSGVPVSNHISSLSLNLLKGELYFFPPFFIFSFLEGRHQLHLPARFLRLDTDATSQIFLDREAPRYPTGYGTSLGMAAAGIIAATTLLVLFLGKNKRRDKLTEDEVRAKYTEDELASLGDRAPTFRYAI